MFVVFYLGQFKVYTVDVCSFLELKFGASAPSLLFFLLSVDDGVKTLSLRLGYRLGKP